MISPCINTCTIDKTTQLCKGCKRTLEEIKHWTKYTDSERELIMLSLKRR